MQTRECRLCHRIGTHGFAPVGGEGWECSNDRACATRATRRARELVADDAADQNGAFTQLRAGRVHHVPLDSLGVSVSDYQAALKRFAQREQCEVTVSVQGCSALIASRTDATRH